MRFDFFLHKIILCACEYLKFKSAFFLYCWNYWTFTQKNLLSWFWFLLISTTYFKITIKLLYLIFQPNVVLYRHAGYFSDLLFLCDSYRYFEFAEINVIFPKCLCFVGLGNNILNCFWCQRFFLHWYVDLQNMTKSKRF